MKQEHKLVAELYRYLAPFINTEEDVFLSLDGQAALIGVERGIFADGTVPDLWFTLVGSASKTLIEAKAIDTDGTVLLMQSQLSAWKSGGHGTHKPQYWVATNRGFNCFYFWAHSDFLQQLDNTKASANTLRLKAPASRQEFPNVGELALHILRHT